ncbi:MAG TPA: energy transducer TonB [Vicinamibacteria bacterium]|nr:energy transducer TonB [Vicinamibacteria bacterium]
MEVLVDRTGVPSELTVLRTVPLLGEAAVSAVEGWRWNPYSVAGKAVPFRVVVTVTFRLT